MILAPGARVETYDPRPWQKYVDRMREAGVDQRLPEHGPWEDEPDDIQWTDPETGYPCWMKRGPAGSWNGYVCVPRNHPWHGLGYDHELELPKGTTSPEELMDVHGCLTFSGHWLSEGDWWFGFDCNHAFDMSPGMPVFNVGSEWGDVYRDAGYVQNQCRLLALQLKEFE